jgi:hypothetical protein
VWTGSIFSLDANGPGNLVTLDNSCTVPAIKGNTSLPQVGGNRYVPFRNFRYTGSFADGGGSSLARSREGHFEIIEMGVLLGDGSTTANNGRFAEEATHVNGTPINCARLNAAWTTGGAWLSGASSAANNTNAPTGGLFGSAGVVDVENGTMLAYNAEAIDGFFFTGNPASDLHFAPGDTSPSLGNAQTSALASPVTSYVFSSGATSTVVTSQWARGIDAVSAIFMVDAIYNEFTTDPSVGAATEWVVTFPTKNFYVDHTGFGGVANLPSAGNGFRFALAPFAGLGFTRSNNGLTASFACEDVQLDIFDREERTTVAPLDFSPLPESGSNALCEETNVIAFSQAGSSTAILGTSFNVALGIDAPFSDGWLQISFPTNSTTGADPGFIAADLTGSLDGDTYFGLPTTGFEAINVINSNAQPGKVANYSGFFKHRGSRAIIASGT